MSAVAIVSTPAAAAERRAAIITTGALSASNNPLLSTTGNAEAMIAEITVNPVLTSETETSKIKLSGTIANRRYSNEFGSYVHGGADLAATLRRSERVEVNASAHYRRDVSVDVADDLAGAISPKSVRNSVGADGSVSLRLSEVSTIVPSLSGERVTYSHSEDLTGYGRFGGSLAYQRQLNPYTSISAGGGLVRYDFNESGNATVASANATIAHDLAPTIDVEATIGVERARFENSIGPLDFERTNLLIAGDGRICRRGEWTNLCLTTSLASQPTALGSLERRISGGLTYAYRLSERTKLGFSADYARSNSLGPGFEDQLQYMQGAATLDQMISKTLTLNAFLNYRSRRGAGSADAGYAGLSLRWTWGDTDHG